MKNIVLLCAAGMSTGMMVDNMREEATKAGIQCNINAHSISEAATVAADADCILLGPQVKFQLNKIKGMFPDKHVDAIDMLAYGMMDGKAVLDKAMELIGK